MTELSIHYLVGWLNMTSDYVHCGYPSHKHTMCQEEGGASLFINPPSTNIWVFSLAGVHLSVPVYPPRSSTVSAPSPCPHHLKIGHFQINVHNYRFRNRWQLGQSQRGCWSRHIIWFMIIVGPKTTTWFLEPSWSHLSVFHSSLSSTAILCRSALG